ncbi:hypothetical protein H8959_022351 [Pygathrix nigripes]
MPPRLQNGLNLSAKVIQGTLDSLPKAVREFLENSAELCQPDHVHICDGSEEENARLLGQMEEEGILRRLKKYDNCWLALTDPRDVARIESKTVIITQEQRDTVPIPKTGLSQLGRWMSEEDFEKAFNARFPGCMKGRTMYVIPFSMGPLGSPLSKIGIELTDSPYVVASMRIMTRMGTPILEALGNGEFVKCLHSVGCPLPLQKPLVNNWPCNPELTLIAHLPDRREIISFGSGYGGNSLLGKKCFALRIASRLAKEEGWLAEHMLTIQKNTIFTNVAETSDGGVYWEGIDEPLASGVTITSWKNKEWSPEDGDPCAHPNSRFCTPASQCPIIDAAWESPEGVPIEGIIFGGRRPTGVPLVYEALSWQHGVFVGAAMRSEATAAAEYKGKIIMHDPFAMRPFFGYNFGKYLAHWLSMAQHPAAKLPKIFHVNWFRKDKEGKFLWPGFGENSRVLEWMFNRIDGKAGAKLTPIGYIPNEDALNLKGLGHINVMELFSISKEFWEEEVEEIEKYLEDQVNADLPCEIERQIFALKQRISQM